MAKKVRQGRKEPWGRMSTRRRSRKRMYSWRQKRKKGGKNVWKGGLGTSIGDWAQNGKLYSGQGTAVSLTSWKKKKSQVINGGLCEESANCPRVGGSEGGGGVVDVRTLKVEGKGRFHISVEERREVKGWGGTRECRVGRAFLRKRGPKEEG